LYDACLGHGGKDLQELAYTELFHYLYRYAYSRYPDIAEDITAQALENIYRRIESCRQPAAFLAFALLNVRNALRQTRRARSEIELSIFEDAEYSIASSETVDASLQKKETLQVLSDAIKQLHLRDQQLILLKYVEGLSDDEISERLGIPVNQIRVLRNRVRHRLRLDSALREYLEEG